MDKSFKYAAYIFPIGNPMWSLCKIEFSSKGNPWSELIRVFPSLDELLVWYDLQGYLRDELYIEGD